MATRQTFDAFFDEAPYGYRITAQYGAANAYRAGKPPWRLKAAQILPGLANPVRIPTGSAEPARLQIGPRQTRTAWRRGLPQATR